MAVIRSSGAGDPDGAARLIVDAARELAEQGLFATLANWIGRLPKAVVEDTPWLIYWQAQARIITDIRSARPALESAFGSPPARA